MNFFQQSHTALFLRLRSGLAGRIGRRDERAAEGRRCRLDLLVTNPADC